MLTITATPLDRPQETTEMAPELSPEQYLSEVIRLLKKEEDTVFGREGIDNNRVLCSNLDEIVELLGNKDRKTEALRLLDLFDIVENVGKKEVEAFLDKLHRLEDINIESRSDEDNPIGVDAISQYRRLEILRSLFIALGVTRVEYISGIASKPTNLILKVYEGHIVDKYYGKNIIDFDKFLDYDDFDSTEGILFLGFRKGTNLARAGELISEVVETVDAIHRDNPGEKEGSIEDIKTSQSRPSWKRIGSERRRQKGTEAKNLKTQEGLQKEKEREYEQKIGELKSYGEQIKFELGRIENFLLTRIPYITEVLDYLHLDYRLKQEGYLEEGETIGDVKGQVLETIAQLESNCSRIRSTIHVIESEIAGLISELSSTNSDGENNGDRVKRIQKHLNRKTARLNKEKDRLEKAEKELSRISNSTEDIISQLQGFRFKSGIPHIDEFEAGVYYSLDAGENYSMPERINQPPVTVQWMEQNILRIFRNILGRHFEWNNITIIDIWELLEKIDDLETKYQEDAGISDIEIIDLGTIRDFVDVLLTIIPIKYIDEIPVFGEGRFKVVTPELFVYKAPTIEQEKKQVKHGGNQKAEKKYKRYAILNEKLIVKEELVAIEQEMMRYVQYWSSKLRGVFRRKRAIMSDIENLKNNMAWRNTNRGKTIEELEDLLKTVTIEFEEIQRKKEDDKSLLQNQEEYDLLEKKRGALQRRLQSLK